MYTARQKNLLKALCSTRKISKNLFQDIEGDIVQLVSDIVYNILYGDDIKVTPKKKQLLLKHKQSLENLSKKVTPFKEKRRIISQKGGFLLPLLAPLAISLISNL